MARKQIDWNKRIEEKFFRIPGQHMLIIGTTGTGKTNSMIYIMLGLLAINPRETIVWIDVGKTSEILLLAQFKPLRIIIPKGMRMDIVINDEWKDKIYDIDVVEADNYFHVWRLLDKECINVVSWRRFFFTTKTYTDFIGGLFGSLIELACNQDILTPLSIFCDELQLIVPEKGNQIDMNHYTAGGVVQMNVELLRGADIRLVGAGQANTKIRKGVRDEMQWKGIKKGCYFEGDHFKLRDFNNLFQKLRPEQLIIADPFQDFSHKIIVPFYGVGKWIGRIRYIGKLDTLQKKKRKAITVMDEEDYTDIDEDGNSEGLEYA
jgi:hypothetical protein